MIRTKDDWSETISAYTAGQTLPILKNFENENIERFILAIKIFRDMCTEPDEFLTIIKEEKIQGEAKKEIGDTPINSYDELYEILRRKSTTIKKHEITDAPYYGATTNKDNDYRESKNMYAINSTELSRERDRTK